MKFASRIRNLIQFQLEQFILRGAVSRLMVIALAMALIACGAGLLVYAAGPAASYEDPGAAVWWAFLRLTDSGYLGDDQGTLLRTVSTALTVLGVVLFVGALIATMTQWLDDTIETLEAGYTPIAQNNHVLILGWNNRTARMIEQLVDSEGRVARFLSRHGGRRLQIVVLAPRVTPALVQEIKDRLGRRFDPRHIILRSGTPLRAEHLRRVDYRHAAAILLPAREFESDSAPDELTIKTLMSAAHSDSRLDPEGLPLMVAEIVDADRLTTAHRAYPGPAEFIGTQQIISRLLAQNTRHHGLSWIYKELLGGGDNQIFVRDCPELAGYRLTDTAGCFDQAVLLGVATEGRLDPLYSQPGYTLAGSDRLAFIARAFEDCRPTAEPVEHAMDDVSVPQAEAGERRRRRVLVLGWNQKLPSLLAEYDAYDREYTEVDVISLVGVEERATILRRKGVALAHATARQIEGDLTSYYEMAEQGVADYDNIILVASDWLGSAEAADARMLVGFLVLSDLLEDVAAPPRILVETMSADNENLFNAPHVERLVSPELQSRMLTQVALRRELHWVMDELFGAGGAEIAFRSASGLSQDGKPMYFSDLQQLCADRNEILLGVMPQAEQQATRLQLNPVDRKTPLALTAEAELIVLAVL